MVVYVTTIMVVAAVKCYNTKNVYNNMYNNMYNTKYLDNIVVYIVISELLDIYNKYKISI